MLSLDRKVDLPGKKKRPAGWRTGSPVQERDETEVRWLMSYSDFMMQLVCLFILLYSVSSVDTSKAIPLAQAWRDEVGIGEARIPLAPRSPHAPLTSADLPALIHEIEVLEGRHPGGGALRVFRSADGFKLQFPCEMFPAGGSLLGKRGVQMADLAALLLAPLQGAVKSIEISGHVSADEAQGEALSLARATETFRWMTRAGAPSRLETGKLEVSGRGAHEPAGDNLTSAGRAVNRRAEFIVHLVPGK